MLRRMYAAAPNATARDRTRPHVADGRVVSSKQVGVYVCVSSSESNEREAEQHSTDAIRRTSADRGMENICSQVPV